MEKKSIREYIRNKELYKDIGCFYEERLAVYQCRGYCSESAKEYAEKDCIEHYINVH